MAVTMPRYTVDDLEQFPRDGSRYELLDGVLIVSPAPGLRHQLIASRIMTRLAFAVQVSGHASVTGPGVVVQLPGTQLEPDVLVFPSRYSLAHEWLDVDEHWLAVEVLSPSTRVYDRDIKRDAYLRLGVREVWIVDAAERTIEVSLAPGETEVVRDTIRWRPPTLDLVVPIDLREIFAGLE